MSEFHHYFNGASDSDAIELEIAPLDSYQNLFQTLQECDSNDSELLRRLGFLESNESVEDFDTSLTQDLFNLIRAVWDAGYSHGEYDAVANELTLEDVAEII